MGQIEALLKPLVIKGLTIRDQVMSTARSPAYGEAGMPGERYRAQFARSKSPPQTSFAPALVSAAPPQTRITSRGM